MQQYGASDLYLLAPDVQSCSTHSITADTVGAWGLEHPLWALRIDRNLPPFAISPISIVTLEFYVLMQ